MRKSTQMKSDLIHLAKSKLHTGFKALTMTALAGALLAAPGISQAAGITALDLRTASAVSGDGSTVAGNSSAYEAMIWTADSGNTSLGTLGGTKSYAKGLSQDGSTVVGYSKNSNNKTEAFIWNEEDGMTGLGTLGGKSSYAYDISADGSTVTGYSDNESSGYQAFIWTQEDGMTGLGTLGGSGSSAMAMSDNGSTVTGYSSNSDGNNQAFIWTEEDGMSSLGTLGGDYSSARDISGDGSTVVGFSNNSDNEYNSFIWTEEDGMTSIGSLGVGLGSYAYSVSADGSVVAGRSGSSAFLWTEETGMLSLWELLTEADVDLSGWTALSNIYGISDDNTIITGYGTNSDGDMTSFVIDLAGTSIAPVPVPAAFWLLGSGLVGLMGLRRRKK